jgi:hypothetical protein
MEQELITAIRDLVAGDPNALDKWSIVLDNMGIPVTDVRRIKNLMRRDEYHEAILQSLNIWWERNQSLADLPPLLRQCHLNALASKSSIMNSIVRFMISVI